MGYTIQERKCAVVDMDGELRDFIDMHLGPLECDLLSWHGNGWSDPYEYWYGDVQINLVLGTDTLATPETQSHPQYPIWRKLVTELDAAGYQYVLLRFTEPEVTEVAPWE